MIREATKRPKRKTAKKATRKKARGRPAKKPNPNPRAPRKPKAPADPIRVLWLSYVAGGRADIDARNLLAEHYQYLVKATTANIAAKLPPHVDMEAMTQAAQFGLLEAVSKFEPDRGFQFATYARPRIFGAAMDELRNMDQVPRLTRIRSAKRQAAEHQLSQAMGRSPTEAEVADQLGCSETDIGDHQPVDTISLEAVVCHNRDDRVLKVGGTIEARASKCGLRTDHRCRHFSRLTRGLDFEARIVLYLHYLAGHTMAEVGRVMRISESRVSQVISQAVKFLRGARDKVEAWEELAEVQQHGGEEGE